MIVEQQQESSEDVCGETTEVVRTPETPSEHVRKRDCSVSGPSASFSGLGLVGLVWTGLVARDGRRLGLVGAGLFGRVARLQTCGSGLGCKGVLGWAGRTYLTRLLRVALYLFAIRRKAFYNLRRRGLSQDDERRLKTTSICLEFVLIIPLAIYDGVEPDLWLLDSEEMMELKVHDLKARSVDGCVNSTEFRCRISVPAKAVIYFFEHFFQRTGLNGIIKYKRSSTIVSEASEWLMHEIILCLEVRKLPAISEFRKGVVPMILSNEFQRFRGMVFLKSRRIVFVYTSEMPSRD
ncbi:hypothetical protein DM860_007084 [Cuscuta australis]|uniref:Uncharacterized protein n=1 Tax=Cuscuta australis TaxID=267555 RepID=A0A328E639_9ASTE|nr:hypothetical protein DM860_007084 [Cuscuta australis]